MNCPHCQTNLVETAIREKLPIFQNVTIQVFNVETGECYESRYSNKIPTIGIFFMGVLLKGATPAPTDLAVGTDNTAAADGDVALAAEVFKDSITQRIDITGGTRFRFFLPTTAANGNTLKEAALLGPLPTLYMLARVTHADIVKSASIAVNYSWDVTFAQP